MTRGDLETCSGARMDRLLAPLVFKRFHAALATCSQRRMCLYDSLGLLL